MGENVENVETVEASTEEKQIMKDIEAVFERFYKGKKAYSKGQYYNNEFFLRTDYALVVLTKKKDILVSFADHTRPSYAALFTLLLDDIEGTDLFICEDYKTDEQGSMILGEADAGSTSVIIWNEKERYYNMLREKVQKVVIRKLKKDAEKSSAE